MLAICIPTFDRVHTGFAMSLARLTAHLAQNGKAHCLVNVRTSDLAISRNTAVEQALAAGATELLWLDSDHEFPPDTYDTLAKADLDIVGATYIKRQSTNHLAHIGAEPGGPIVPVKALPGGMCLVKADVYKTVAYPWYETRINPATRQHSSTDYTFAQKAARADYTSWLHKPLSESITHLDEVARQIPKGAL